jgi:nucleotide-binding universal stress UspA family protein
VLGAPVRTRSMLSSANVADPEPEPAALRSILMATDLSAEADLALQHASFLAQRFGAALTLFHAVEVSPDEYLRWAGREDEVWAHAEATARAELARRTEQLTVPCRVLVKRGVPAPSLLADVAVLELIHALQPDLSVIAAYGRARPGGLFLGSVASQVLQHAGRPVLCVRAAAAAGAALPYRHILVPTDFSEASRRPFALAALLARTLGASVVGLHVLKRQAPDQGAQQELARFLGPELAGPAVEARVERGAPWDRIVHVAREQGCDLIAMSTRGLDSLGDKILGSNAERVVRRAACPVLVA